MRQWTLVGLLFCSLGLRASLASGAQEQDQPSPADDRQTRYFPSDFGIDERAGQWSGQPGHAEMLLQLGVFERAQLGESVELMALRLGLDPSILRLTSGLEPGHVFARDEVICVQREHQCFPDEDLEFLAELHGTDVATLRALNGWGIDQEPAPWARIRVPARYTEVHEGGQSHRVIKVFHGDIDRLLQGQGPIRLPAMRLDHHAVAEGDSWESIAAAHGVTVAELHFAERFAREMDAWTEDPTRAREAPERGAPELQVGEKVIVGVRVDREPGGSTDEMVLALEYLCGDLRAALALNGLDAPEALPSVEELRVPLAVPSLQLALIFGPGGVMRQLEELGYVMEDEEDDGEG